MQGTSHGWWPKGSRKNRTANWASEPRPCSHAHQHTPGDTRTSARARSVDPAPPGKSLPSGAEGKSVVSQGTEPLGTYASVSIAVRHGASRAVIIMSSRSEGGAAHRASTLRLSPLDLPAFGLGGFGTLTEKFFSM